MRLGGPPLSTDDPLSHAILLNIQPWDEVIVPAYTFVSADNAFVLRGARPAFCNIRSDALNLDESKLEALITPRTRAIVPVHKRGRGARWMPLWRLSIAMASRWSKTMHTGSSEDTRADGWGLLGAWQHKVFRDEKYHLRGEEHF